MARNVSGQWFITQSNGFRVNFDIVQNGGEIHGSAKVDGGLEANGQGSVDDRSFFFVVDWHNNGQGGEYSGIFDPQGRLSGTTRDLEHPTSQATWFSNRFF